ncbi:MAG: DUF4340 domain-containing protein [Ruminococcaceae bacterium]|nr:DUF4340 domain-containing protein [Oscillospiraceae bacterium]
MKLTKSVKSVIIAAGVLLVLGVVMMILMLTAPKENGESSSSEISSSVAETVNITGQQTDNVLKLTVSNENGSYTFERQKRVVSSTDSEGKVSSQDEYYWTTADLKGVPQSDTTVRNFVNNLAALPAKSVVEENAEDLDKYGLESPLASADVSFEDGSRIKLNFGIQNPASTSSAYCCTEGSNTVYLVNYYSVSGAYSAVNSYANLVLTDTRNSDGSNELDYLRIQRKDLDEEIEIRYMFDVAEDAESEDSVISTFNTHRFIKPLTAEIDITTGSSVCIGMYGMTMDACEYLEQTDENMKACGLDDPFLKMTFKYGGNIRTLLLGNEIISETEGGNESSPTLRNVIGYYAVLEGTPGIYSIAKDSAPWYTFKVSTIISRQPLTPYIYTVENVTVTTSDGEFKFDIDGENKRFFHSGSELDGDEFKKLYQQLISSIGEEMYTEQTDAAPAATVKFRYKSKYFDTYGTEEDVVEFIPDGGRKYIINLNGRTIFKVREIYVTRLIENIDALLNGGTVSYDW